MLRVTLISDPEVMGAASSRTVIEPGSVEDLVKR